MADGGPLCSASAGNSITDNKNQQQQTTSALVLVVGNNISGVPSCNPPHQPINNNDLVIISATATDAAAVPVQHNVLVKSSFYNNNISNSTNSNSGDQDLVINSSDGAVMDGGVYVNKCIVPNQPRQHLQGVLPGGPIGTNNVLLLDHTTTMATSILDINVMMPANNGVSAASTIDEDCRKKRCVDRYDSSESSDSGVAILSCTDCSGSSTASSDITDPGSPYSTASSHSDDSGSQPPKMPPTQSAHHPPWPWTDTAVLPTTTTTTTSTTTHQETTSLKRVVVDIDDKEDAFNSNVNKRIKTNISDENETTPICLNNLNNNVVTSSTNLVIPGLIIPMSNIEAINDTIATTTNTETTSLIINNFNKQQQKQIIIESKMQQGKITEYFKSQYKPTLINHNKKELANILIKHKFINLVESNNKKINGRGIVGNSKVQIERLQNTKRRINVPRKILPAPSKIENVQYPPMISHTLIPHHNLAYIQQKQEQTLNNKVVDSLYFNQLPTHNTTSPLVNVIQQPLQKISQINNFNCVKLNTATQSRVVPLKLSLSTPNQNQNAFITSLQNNNKPTLDIISNQYTASTIQNITFAAALSNTNTEPGLIADISPSPSSAGGDSGCLSSLEVNVDCAVMGGDVVVPQAEQRSPILSQPKTIRFPAKERVEPKGKLVVSSDTALCQWDECIAQFDTNGALLDHLQVNHVISQASQEQYVCLWQGCKVHGRKSCSRSWLERHVLAHAGSKPYRCIVDGCGQRFNSQLALERHVNGHFNTDNTQASSAKKSVENGSVKLFRRNGKKIRFRRQPWSARMFDFIDSGIMEGLQYKLLSMTEKRTLGQFDATNVNDGDQVTLQSEVIAKRLESDGQTKMLLRWFPTDVVEDEWVLEKNYTNRKTVSIPNLKAAAKTSLTPILFPPSNSISTTTSSPGGQPDSGGSSSSSSGSCGRQKHRRKPCKILTT